MALLPGGPSIYRSFGHNRQAQLLPEESAGAFRGCVPSKRRYFYGLRVHLVVSAAGELVEFALGAGSEADVTVFKDLELEVPEDSIIFADKGYTDYDHEDLLQEVGLHLKAQEELQAADASVGGVLGQAHSPIYRNGL